jgi:hypothetical protein
LYIAKNPGQRPIGIQVNHEGIASTIDLGIQLRISRIGVRAPKLPKLVKISKDQKRALSWQNNTFHCAVICVLTQEGHYASRVAHLGLTVNSRNTNSTYSGPFNGNGEVDTDDAVCYLAKTGRTLEWAAHESIVEFARAYIHEWIRRRTPSSRDDMRLRCVYASIYPQPPNVELLDPTASVSEQLEVIPRNAAKPPAVASHPCAPRSPALSSESKLFGPNVNMNAPEYPHEPEYTPDIRGVDDGPSSM